MLIVEWPDCEKFRRQVRNDDFGDDGKGAGILDRGGIEAESPASASERPLIL